MPSDTCARTGTFEFFAVIDRYGQRLDMPRTYAVEHSYHQDDPNSVRYARILDEIGAECDVSELHGSSLFHAFKASIANNG